MGINMIFDFIQNHGLLLFGTIGVVLLIVMQLNDFINFISGDDEE